MDLRSTNVSGSNSQRVDGDDLLWFQPVLSSRRSKTSAHTRRLFVLVQVAFERERLATPCTRVRLVGRVRLDVSSKVGLVGECLGAVRTVERAFSGVRTDMALQQPRPWEPFTAVWACTTLCVCPHVHAVCRYRSVHLQYANHVHTSHNNITVWTWTESLKSYPNIWHDFDQWRSRILVHDITSLSAKPKLHKS